MTAVFVRSKCISTLGLEFVDATEDVTIGWDSAGNDHAHDGQGIGHEAGDHTGHGRAGVKLVSLESKLSANVSEGMTLNSLVELRNKLLEG
jgi:hypothetical protein